jgi:RHS repeat-associated protein
MPVLNQNVLCRYHYDALDRLTGTTSERDAGLQRFYCKNRLATEVKGVVQRSIFQQNEHLFSQQDRYGDAVEVSLLVTDQMRSVLQVVKEKRPRPIAYSPYGHRPAGNGLLSLLGFNSELPDPVTGHYLLGNGYRAFNPVLMRFNCPDSMSPFGQGGLNSYAYCLGDPINRTDESGHNSVFREVLEFFRFKPKTFKNLEKYSVDENFITFKELQQKAGKPLVFDVSTADDMNCLDFDESAKFVFTKDKKLIFGLNVKHHKFISHSALTGDAKNVRVISAGYIHKELDGSVILNNVSGHYKPYPESLDYVKKHIEKNNIALVSELIRMYPRKTKWERTCFKFICG